MSASELRTGRIAQADLLRNLGLQIVKLRKGRGWSQGDLAKQLGVNRSNVGKWERGLSAPSLEDLTALATLFGVTLDELVHGEEAPPSPLPVEKREQLTMLLNGLVRVLGPLTGRTRPREKKSLSGAAVAPASTTQGGQR